MTEELPWRILVVCTANQCRSPMAEARTDGLPLLLNALRDHYAEEP